MIDQDLDDLDWISHVLAKKFSMHNYRLYEDLRQEARIGIYMALGDYDPTKGATLQTHAYNIAKSQIRHYLRSYQHLVHVPNIIKNQKYKNEELKDVAPIQICDIDAVAEISGQGFEMEVLDKMSVNFDQLTDREFFIVNKYFYFQYNFAEISRMMGISQTYVKNLYNQALVKLRNCIGAQI